MRLGHTVLSNLASGLYNRLLRNVALSGLFAAGLYVTGFLHNPFILNQLLSAGTKSGVLTAAFALFGFTIVQSFFTMQFLGLYGVFMCQLVALVFLWVALCLNAECVAFCGLDYKIVLFKWFTLSPHIVVNFELYVDLVSISFAILTTSIAVFVLIYAFAYFRYEPNVDRLILMLCAFVWSMVLLVLSGNMFVLLLGWELIGLTSFMLINFWATRVGTFKAAFKAFTFNKISDAALIFAIVIMSLSFQDLSIQTILAEVANLNTLSTESVAKVRAIELAATSLVIAASIKSAQLIGHLWLPDSMEAPVPASALIHSATLVSAGLFLVLRLYPMFEHSWVFCNVVPVLGAATAAYGGLVAAYQTDVKRLLAYSTISHCGFLMLLASMGSVEHTLVYLYIHGFFKAMAFLCVGNVIRFAKNYQDLRRMGNFWKFLPAELSLLTLALLNLSGAPFFWGFTCKHLVVAASASIGLPSLTWSLALLGAITGPSTLTDLSPTSFLTPPSRLKVLFWPQGELASEATTIPTLPSEGGPASWAWALLAML